MKFRGILFCSILSVHITTTNAQSGAAYQHDLEKLYSVLQKTPSFKDQVKGEKKQVYEDWYASLKSDTAISNNFDAFVRLSQLFFPIRDNHLGFYQLLPEGLPPASFNDTPAVKWYRNTKTFMEYPRNKMDLDSLEKVLSAKPADSLEGIYYYDDFLKIGLYRTPIHDRYVGVVLSTTLPVWDKGQIAMWLYENEQHSFRAIYGHPVYKYFLLYNNERFRNRSLVNSHFYISVTESVYKKQPGEKDHVTIAPGTPEFDFRSLSPQIQYLRLGNFSAMNVAMKESQAFYERIKDSLTSQHLIVDLRDNSGGAAKVSNKFLKLLRKYSRNGKIYVLVNNGTMSRGEIFTLQLKQLRNIKVFGQTTMGTLAYGSNSGKTVKLPSGKFQVYITDMKDRGNLLRYESIGVEPDEKWDNNSDWISRILAIIETRLDDDRSTKKQ